MRHDAAGQRSGDARVIIAVDGPAASGKGTLAAGLARHYGLPHLDTGLLYRAVGRAVAEFDGTAEFEARAIAAALGIDTSHLDPQVLSTQDIGTLASKVAPSPDRGLSIR